MSSNDTISAQKLANVLSKVREAAKSMDDDEREILMKILKQGLLSGDETSSAQKAPGIDDAINILNLMGDLDPTTFRACRPHYTMSYSAPR